MERDQNPWLLNSFSPSPSSPSLNSHSTFDYQNSLLHLHPQFSQLSLSSLDSAAAPPPSINNYSSNSWMAAYLQREAEAAAAADLQRLRVNSAVIGSGGYCWAPPLSTPSLNSGSGLGLGPTRDYIDSGLGLGPTRDYIDPYDQYADALLRRRVMLANGGGGGDYFSTLNHNNNAVNMNRFRYNPVHSMDRTAFTDRAFLYNNNNNRSLNNNGRRSSRNNNHHHHHHHHHRHNNRNNSYNSINYNGGGTNSSSSSLNDMQLMAETMKLPNWNELRGKIGSLCMDPKSHGVLQCMLTQGQIDGLEIAVSEVKDDITEITTHQLGFLFFKNLLDICDDHQFSEILCAVMLNNRNFLDICLHSQGTYAVQQVLRKVNKDDLDQRAVVSSAMVPITVTLCKDNIGNHVMIACLKAFEGVNDVIGPILEQIANHCLEIAKDKSGCCVLQQCLAQPEGLHGRQRILALIISNAVQLSEHEFGNYVVQYVIGMRSEITNSQLIKKLEGSFTVLSKSKYGSHVVEKCLKDARDEKAKIIIKELTLDPNFIEILQNNTGNYVAQTALHRSKAMPGSSHPRSSHQLMVNRIQNSYAFLHSHPFGKNVISHMKCKCKLEEFGFNSDYLSY